VILGLTSFCALFGHYLVHEARGTYPYTVPFVTTAFLCSLVGLVAVVKNTRGLSLIQNALAVLTVVLYELAAANWPGGDDGPGLGFAVIVAPVYLGALLAISSTIRDLKTTSTQT
jgi:hypothetical protein